MTRPSPTAHEEISQLPLPPQLHDMRIDLYSDLFYVNSVPFLLVISGRLNCISIMCLAFRAATNIIRGLLREIRRYVRRGCIIVHVHSDREYDKATIKDAIKPATMKIRAPEEHWGVAERRIRTIKERVRCTIHSLPYLQYPKSHGKWFDGAHCRNAKSLSANKWSFQNHQSSRIS